MGILSLFGTQKEAEPTGENNRWFAPNDSATAVVFVHGVLSNANSSWYNPRTGAYWPRLVAQDPDFGAAAVFLGGYYTEISAGDYGVRECAQELLSNLSSPTGGRAAVLDHERLVFVCHSLGGIVTRYMLECWREAFREKTILLALVASPSLGSDYASLLSPVAWLYRNKTGRELKWRSHQIEDLDERFKDLLRGKLVRLSGFEAIEQSFVFSSQWLSWVPGLVRAPLERIFGPVVPYDSGARYFEAERIPKTDHFTIATPENDKARVHRWLRESFRKFDRQYPAQGWPPPRPAAASGPAAIAEEFQCERLTWEVHINADGDGYHLQRFHEITAARAGDQPQYVLARGRMSGAGSRRLLCRTDRSPDITMQDGPNGETIIGFGDPPTAGNPQRFQVESLTCHSFSMHSGERALAFSPSEGSAPRDSNTDHIQKTLRFERVEELVMTVQFPETLRLEGSNPVFVKAYHLFQGTNGERKVLDERLTRQAGLGLYYSPLLRTAILKVHKPPAACAFRLGWKLSEPAEQELSVDQQARLDDFRTAILQIPALAADAPERFNLVLKAMAEFGADLVFMVEKIVGKLRSVSPSTLASRLEISLMGLDTMAPKSALRIVAGTQRGSETNDPLPLGDGVAGRAARQLQVRVFDEERARNTVFESVYAPSGDGRQHCWLISIPLWDRTCGQQAIGVLNIGTFNPSEARVLRCLDRDRRIAYLLKLANDRFLPKIWQVLDYE